MNTQRTIDDLTPEERERIVAGWRRQVDFYVRVLSDLFHISEDTVRDVLRKEGE